MMIIPKGITISIVILFAIILANQYVNEQKKYNHVFIPDAVHYFTPFYFFVLLSCLWTINKNNYSFALIRALLTFEFTWFITYNCREMRKIPSILHGFIFGGLLSSTIVLYNQHQFIGLIRIGNGIYGSAMEYSGGLIVANIACIMMWEIRKEKKYLLFFILFLILCGLSGSRSALVLPFVFWGAYHLFYKQNFIRLAKVILLIALCGIITIVATQKNPILYNVVGKRIETLVDNKKEDESATERAQFKSLAWEIWTKHPIFGVGCHGFGKINESQIGRNVYSHCDYAEIFSCYGLVGAILFYGPFFLLLKRKRLLMNAKNNVHYSLFLAFLVTMALNSTATIFYLNLKNMILIGLSFFVVRYFKQEFPQ